jgi:molybdopterin-containing oxidoreductase family membrane subunit
MSESTINVGTAAMPAGGRHDYASVNRLILGNIRPVTRMWWIGFLLLLSGVGLFFYCEANQFIHGQGVNGMNNPVMWGTMLVNFVFWVGIGHAGTLISAILYLLRARFRTAVARSAEAMTVFAVITAGLFPLFHMGRTWLFFWMLPYPNQRELWPNFVSPLIFDVVAISTYLTVSVMFWYIGLLPDLAAARDRFTGWRGKVYRVLSLGWSNNHRNWRHYTRAYLFFAAMATPLVISVHSVVSWDFSLSLIPGWHSTIFPPYFVSGAIHSGMAMVLALLIPVRKFQRLESIITIDVLEKMAKVLILTGLILGYSYVFEFLVAFYSQNQFEIETFLMRFGGFAAIPFWIMISCNVLVPLVFLVKKIRRSLPWLLTVGILINVGMWYERYVIIITQSRDFIPYSWGSFFPGLNEFGLIIGSFSWFGMWFWLFLRFLPTVSITEVKEELPPPVKEARHG